MPGRRLVEAQELRLGGERNADLEIALLAVRKVGGKLIRLAAQPDQFQHGLRLVDKVAVGVVMREHAPTVAARLRGNSHIFQGGGVGQDIGDLVGAGDALSARCDWAGKPGDVLAIEQNAARSLGRSTPVRQLKKVLFPAPFGPMMARISPRCDLEIDVVERRSGRRIAW